MNETNIATASPSTPASAGRRLSFSIGGNPLPTSDALRTSPISTPRYNATVQSAVKPAGSSKITAQNRKARKSWTQQEDASLLTVLREVTTTATAEDHPESTVTPVINWRQVAETMGSKRSAKQCRDRYLNQLRDGIKKGEWTKEEESLLCDLHQVFGPRWSSMAKVFKVRTDNDIKNKWYAMMRKQQRTQPSAGDGRQNEQNDEVVVPMKSSIYKRSGSPEQDTEPLVHTAPHSGPVTPASLGVDANRFAYMNRDSTPLKRASV